MKKASRVPRKLKVLAALGCASFLLCGCVDDREIPAPVEVVAERPKEECSGVSEVGTTQGTLVPPQVRLDQEQGFPCRVVAVQQPLKLLPSEDGSRPDPFWYALARDSAGRIYTAGTPTTGPGTVLVWSPNGQFERTVGSPGEGPGELSVRGLLGLILLGRDDSLYVKEDTRWSVFDRSHRFARVIAGSAVQSRYGKQSTRLLATGEFLIAEPVPEAAADQWFHIADAEGRWVRSFGPKRPISSQGRIYRAVAYDGDSTFWAAPPNGAPDGYVLERWTTGGTLLQRITRDVDWFDDARVDLPREQPLPHFSRLILDDQGLLWIVMAVKDPRWVPSPSEEQHGADGERPPSHELHDIRYEVIDPVRGRVLASGLVDRPDSAYRVAPVFPGSRLDYGRMTDSLGFETLQFYELFLVPQDR